MADLCGFKDAFIFTLCGFVVVVVVVVFQTFILVLLYNLDLLIVPFSYLTG